MDLNEAIKIIYLNHNNNNKIKKIKVKRKVDGRTESEERDESDFFLIFLFSSLISQIYGNRTVNFSRSRRQSWSTRRELRVGTKSLTFRQTPIGREFSYLSYF